MLLLHPVIGGHGDHYFKRCPYHTESELIRQ